MIRNGAIKQKSVNIFSTIQQKGERCFEHLVFEFWICFGFRISCFEFYLVGFDSYALRIGNG
jgi:hypothetical protein